MRAFACLGFAALFFLAAVSPGCADTVVGTPKAGDPKIAIADESIEQLFATLADRSDEQRARQAEAEIQHRWMQSGSPTIDLLMGFAREAVDAKNDALALDYLDQVVMLKPDYAEGWNRRAMIFYRQDAYGKALALDPYLDDDIRDAVKRLKPDVEGRAI